MASAAEQLFESIDLDAIQAFVDEQRQETLHLEFKTLNEPLTRDDRRNLAKALSGFANSDGGVIVWGVATATVDGVDSASGLAPISDGAAVRSAFESWTGEAVTPFVDGVLHEHLDGGFIKTLVPASDNGPHMAKMGEQRYYKRAGDSFYRMEHHDVADMFGRRPRPQLELHSRLSSPNQHKSNGLVVYNTSVVLSVFNAGRAVARFPYVELAVRAPYQRPTTSVHDALDARRSLQNRRATIFVGGSDAVVHPGLGIDFATIAVHDIPHGTEHIDDVVIDYTIAAGSMQPATKTLTMTGEEIIALLLDKFSEED